MRRIILAVSAATFWAAGILPGQEVRSAKVAVTSAKIYIQAKKYDEALKVLEQGRQRDANHPEIYLYLGIVWCEKGQYARADSGFTLAVQLDPDLSKEASKQRLHYWQPLARDGVEALNRKEEDGKVDPKDLEKAIDLLEKAAVIDPSRPEGLVNLAIAYFDAGRYGDAVGAFRRTLILTPGDTSTSIKLALAFMAAGQVDSAKAVYEDLRRKDPQDVAVLTNLANIHVNAGDYPAAAGIYDSLLTQPEIDANTYYNAGVAYLQMQAYEKAAGAFEKVLEAAPGDIDAMTNLSIAYLQLKRFDKAVPLLERMVASDPTNAGYWENLAVAYVSTGQNEKAHLALEKARDLEKGKVPEDTPQ